MRLPNFCTLVLGGLWFLCPFFTQAQIKASHQASKKVIRWYCEWKGILGDSPQAYRLGEVAWAQATTPLPYLDNCLFTKPIKKLPSTSNIDSTCLSKKILRIRKIQLKSRKTPRLALAKPLQQAQLIHQDTTEILTAQVSSPTPSKGD